MKKLRKGPDFIVKMISYITSGVWVVLIIALMAIGFSKTSGSVYSSIRTYSGTSSGSVIMPVVFVILVLLALFSIAGIVINMTRLKRKTDHIHVSLVVSAALSIGAIVLLSMK